MNITFEAPDKGSMCFKMHTDSTGKLMTKSYAPCHGRLYSFSNKDSYCILFEKSETVVSKDDLERWIDFCTKCGFPSTLSEVTLEGIGYPKIHGTFYKVDFPMEEYVSVLHVFAATTVIRMISYRGEGGYYVEESQRIVKEICKIIQSNPDTKPLDTLILAHRVAEDSGHFLLSPCYQKTYSTFKSMTLIEAFKENETKTLNYIFSKIDPINL